MEDNSEGESRESSLASLSPSIGLRLKATFVILFLSKGQFVSPSRGLVLRPSLLWTPQQVYKCFSVSSFSPVGLSRSREWCVFAKEGEVLFFLFLDVFPQTIFKRERKERFS